MDFSLPLLVDCPTCGEARKAMEKLSHLTFGKDSRAVLRASCVGLKKPWPQELVNDLAIRCDRCHSSGQIPSPTADPIDQLLTWLTAHSEYQREQQNELYDQFTDQKNPEKGANADDHES